MGKMVIALVLVALLVVAFAMPALADKPTDNYGAYASEQGQDGTRSDVVKASQDGSPYGLKNLGQVIKMFKELNGLTGKP